MVALFDSDGGRGPGGEATAPAHHHHDDLWRLEEARRVLNRARGSNAVERCAKFMQSPGDLSKVSKDDGVQNHSKNIPGLISANRVQMQSALDHVEMRVNDLGEARPELGHATNAAVVVGGRGLTKNAGFLARRAFLASYDWRLDDADGSNLATVLTPALIVCSGISLEYFFR